MLAEGLRLQKMLTGRKTGWPQRRLAVIAVAAASMGAAIAALAAGTGESCFEQSARLPEGTGSDGALKLWPLGTDCAFALPDGAEQSLFLGPSKFGTLVVSALVAVALIVVLARRGAPWARVLGESLVIAATMGLLAHLVGFSGVLLLGVVLGWPLVTAVDFAAAPPSARSVVGSAVTAWAVVVSVMVVWGLFALGDQDAIGVTLALALPAAVTFAATRLRSA